MHGFHKIDGPMDRCPWDTVAEGKQWWVERSEPHQDAK
jgi:hypothetical protein